MILILIISYFFLVLSSGIQAIFAKAYSTPEEAPAYFSTPLKLVPTLFAYGLTYIHFDAFFNFEFNIFLKIIIHLIIAVLSSALAQTIYINTHGLSRDSALHVMFSIVIGSILLILWSFLT